MAGDSNKMEDAVGVVLNPTGDDDTEYSALPTLSARPANSAQVSEWVDYCVELGASRHFLENDTTHVSGMEADGQTAKTVTYSKMSKAELQDLATGLGG